MPKGKPTFVPVKTEVKKKNLSVAQTLVSGNKTASAPSRVTPLSQSPQKPAMTVSPASLITSIKEKGKESDFLKTKTASLDTVAGLLANKPKSSESLPPQLIPTNEQLLSSLDLPPVPSPKCETTVSNEVSRSSAKTETSLQSLMDELINDESSSLLISPTEILHSQTPLAHQNSILSPTESVATQDSFTGFFSTCQPASAENHATEFLVPNYGNYAQAGQGRTAWCIQVGSKMDVNCQATPEMTVRPF
jgi:hypothetical protein